MSNISVSTPQSSIVHEAVRRPPPAASSSTAQQHQVMMITRLRSSVANDSSSDEEDGGVNESIQVVTSAQAVESILASSSKQFQAPVRPNSIYELYVDPRWVTLGKETPSSSSFDAILARAVPPGTVTKNSFSLRLAALRRGTAYIEFAPQFEPLKNAIYRQLFLLEVNAVGELLPVQSEAVGLDSPLPQEHTFSGLKRGAEYCVVHLASTRRPVEWIGLEDLVVSDGIQFRTPMYAVDSLAVTEIFSRSASIQWEGNASNYIVTLCRVPSSSSSASLSVNRNPNGDDDEDVDNTNITQSFSSSTGFMAFTSLASASLYRVQVVPQQKVEFSEASASLALGVESLEGYFCTSIEPDFSNVKVRAACGNAIGTISLLVTHPVFDLLYPQHSVHIEPIVLLNSIERNAMDVAAGRPVDLEVQLQVSLKSRDSGATILERRAGGPLKSTVGPFDAVISVDVQNIEAENAEVVWKSTANDHTISVALARPVGDDGDYEEQHLLSSGSTRTVLLQHLRPATDYIVKVSGKTCVNVISASLRTLPAAPASGECNVRHSFARRELRIALPADSVTAAFFDDEMDGSSLLITSTAQSPGTPPALGIGGGNPLNVREGDVVGLAVLIKPSMRSFESSNKPTVVVEDISHFGAQGVLVEISKTLRTTTANASSATGGNIRQQQQQGGELICHKSAPRYMTAVTNIAAFVDEQTDTVEFRWTAVSSSNVFTVGLGSSFLTVTGLRATFPLPRDTPTMFSQFVVTGQDVIPEDSPLYFAAPPPPPSRGLFQTKALLEDLIRIDVHSTINSILDQVPQELRDHIEIFLEFDSPCFQTVVRKLPIATATNGGDEVHDSRRDSRVPSSTNQSIDGNSGNIAGDGGSIVDVPLLLNRQKDATITVRFVIRNKKSGPVLQPPLGVPSSAAMNEAVILNSSVMKSLTTAIPTPVVFSIANLEILALQPMSCSLRWSSLNPLHEVSLVSNDDFKFAAKTIQPEIVLNDLSPQTLYHIVIRGSESGGHRAEMTFCTPPSLSADELSRLADKVVVDGRRFTCELPPTFLQHVTVHGTSGILRSQRRLLLWSQPPVEWISNDHAKPVCTASLTKPDLRHGETWPYLTVEGCCTAEQLGPVVCSSPSHAAQQFRIDLVGMVSLEMRDAGSQAVLTWSGSSDSYVITMRVGRSQETQIHRKMSPKHVFDTAPFRGQLLYFMLRAEGPSNIARFSVAVPPEIKPLRVVNYIPTQLTFMLPAPQFFEELEVVTTAVVEDTKFEHSGASMDEEAVSVQLRPVVPKALNASTKKSALVGSPTTALRAKQEHDKKSPPNRKSSSPASTPTETASILEPPQTSIFINITQTVTLRSNAMNSSEHVCLNAKMELPLRQPLAILKLLQGIILAHVSPNSAEITWKSDDTEFFIEATTYQPIPLGDKSSSSSHKPERNSEECIENSDEEIDSKANRPSSSAAPQATASLQSKSLDGESTPIASHRKFVVASPVVRLRNLLPATLHSLLVRGRQCGDAAIQISFLTPPMFHDNSVVLRRHKDGLACSVLADFPIESYKCGEVVVHAETRIDLHDEFGEILESIQCRDGHCKFLLPCPLTSIHCVRALRCSSSAASLLGHHVANADPTAEMLLAKIPKMSVMKPLRLCLSEPNSLRVAWGCSASRGRFTLTATPVASVNSLGGAPVPKRTLTCDESCEASIPSLTPATLYEIHVMEDCSYSIFPNPAEQQRVVIHDDAPPAPHVMAHAVTAPKRAAVTVPKRYFAGITISLNAERRLHQSAQLALFSAIRLIPDNTIFVTSLPHTTSCTVPNPTLLTSNARPTFVTTNGAPGAELHSVEITLTEPAGSLTHRLEYFQVCEVLPDSPYFDTMLNDVQFSEPEVQPIELIRTIHKAHVTHTTSHKMELQWEATHDKMRCDVALQDLLRSEQPEIIHRVVDNRLLVDGLSSGTPYHVTITPSYYNVPCEPLHMTVLTAPKRPKAPKVHIAMLNAIFDIPATTRQATTTEPDLILTTTHTALVICTKESDVSDCHSATDFLSKTQTKNVFKSADIVQRVDLRLRSGKSYLFVFFSSVHHPCSFNGIVHSKPAVIVHQTDCYSPQNLHTVTRSKNSITVGWSSVDTGSKILRFQVEMVPVFARYIAPDVPFARDPVLSQQQHQSPPNQRGARQQRGPDGVSVVLSQLYGKRKSLDEETDSTTTQKIQQQRPPAVQDFRDAYADPGSGLDQQGIFDDEENKKVIAVDCTSDKPAMHCTFSFLQQGLTYAFRVRQIAADSGVASAWSAVLQVETMQPPRPVERLQVIGVAPNSFQVAWVDKQGGAAESMTYIVQCKAERSGPGVAAQKAVERTVHTTSCEVDGLLPATQYRVTVIPCNHYGESCSANNAMLLVRTEAPVNWII